MNRRLKILWLLPLLPAVFAASCATAPPPASPAASSMIGWPPPPDQARIVYVGSLHGPADIGQSPSVFSSMARWITGDTGQSKNLHKPFAVALDEQGNLCVADTDDKLVCYLDFAHKKWQRYAGPGKIRFASPVAVARHNGIFYVADSQLAQVIAFKDDGKALFKIGAPLKRPVGLTVANDSLYIVDSQAHSVFVYDLNGKFLFSFGQRGTGPGEFNFPTGITADTRHDRLIVADTMNFRVQIFDLHGKYLSQFGSNGDTSGHFARPKGVAVDSDGHIYVVDGVFDNFQIFDADGRLLLDVGEGGDGPGQFALPNGIALGPDNRVYVADAFNHRVQIFKYLDQQGSQP
ncbi:MAG TPA: 6-bladed beta-propeller [Candidatus Sulfotelmatobacter sp.]|jgi:sugar lactone lactonase YvrE|nr:6-bladed beta-propeller [Candidatus Sulfotelmatobacter sp.]